MVFVMERGDDERKRVAGSQERLVVMSLSSTSNRHQKGWLKMEREKKKERIACRANVLSSLAWEEESY